MTERLFLLQQAKPIFQGRPNAHWMHGSYQSLPPPSLPASEPAIATPAPERQPVPARAHFVLDWQVRMSKWIFEDNYTHRKLGRRPKVFLLEHDALGQRFLWKATEINPKPRTSKGTPFK